jgi:hypothetical protein
MEFQAWATMLFRVGGMWVGVCGLMSPMTLWEASDTYINVVPSVPWILVMKK